MCCTSRAPIWCSTITMEGGSYGCHRRASQVGSDRWIEPPQNVAVGEIFLAPEPIADDDARKATHDREDEGSDVPGETHRRGVRSRSSACTMPTVGDCLTHLP
ncbi:hypothetical protein ACLOJK_038618 [Asimina triloba]